ncbi:hypothetical protein HPB49_001521 [Dermacentor silvarum]|uniref:Uncharacterized protein n=1 Tax=Dermacentor silvarum TaxID=543639 RepID=A0ACB8DM10_DERSI|nr:hypothetical protein HPB49_001521 [Dermacentor silvarum]
MTEVLRRPVPPLSLSNEARRTSSNRPDYGLIPSRPWLIILDYLDAESRLAVADLGPNFERLVHGERCMRNVICGANHESAPLRSLLEGGRWEHVRALHLTNCIVATPDSLLACVALCKRLTDLRCIGCPLDADLLLKVVTKWLPSLQRLEWSLCVRNVRQALHAGQTADGSELALLPSAKALERVYVEVECQAPTSHSFLALFVTLCPNLRRLHVHELRAKHSSAFELAHLFVPHVSVFTYSTNDNVILGDQDFSGEHDSSRAQRPRSHYAVCGNLTYVGGSLPLQPANCVSLDDLVLGRCVPGFHRLGRLILNVPGTAEAPLMLEQAAGNVSWTGLRALTVVLAPKPDDILAAGFSSGNLQSRSCGHRCVRPVLARALGVLLNACRTLAELNLSAFHFSEERMVFKDITSGLGQLRALSVAPCALMSTRVAPLRNIAELCTRLEELDVRWSRLDAAFTPPCSSCSEGFVRLKDLSGPAFHNWRNNLQRLTLYNVRRIRPLRLFASAFHVTELRLCGIDALPGRDGAYEVLGRILNDSPCLRSLVIEHDALPVFTDFLRRELGRATARQLRYLCLLSKVASRRTVIRRFAGSLLRDLPSLISLHVHCAVKDDAFVGAERRITWVRRARGWFANNFEDGKLIVLEEDQCVLCCTSTFVGLAKPRNRDWCML